MKFVVELGVIRSLRVVGKSDVVLFVGQKCLPTLLALGKMALVVKQMWIVVDRAVFDIQPGGYRDYWLKF